MGRSLRTRVFGVLLCTLLLTTAASAAPPPGKGPPSGPACPTGTAAVVLDPGHGGGDPGAINGTFGLIEKDLTLAVANEAAAILQGQGYSVALTRYGDTGLGNRERGEIANACGASVFVSIHFNSASDPTVNYTKTFWGKRRKDEAFSLHMNAVVFSSLQNDAAGNPTNLANGGTGQFATGSLLHADMPGTLVETVFLSNTEEAQRLAQDGVRVQQIAAAIAAGVASWLSQ